MSGKLEGGEVSSAQSYDAEKLDMLSTDMEHQVEENSVTLVTPDRSDQMAPRTRSHSSKPADVCDLLLSRVDSMSPAPAVSFHDNAKRCIEDNELPMQKRRHQCVDNGSAAELQCLNDRFRREREWMETRISETIQCVENDRFRYEREYIENRCLEIIQYVEDDLADGRKILHDQFQQQNECIEHHFAEQRTKLDQKINKLKAEISKGAKREKVAAEKITDDTIKSKWNALRYNIRSVVLMLRSCEPKGAKDTPEILRLGIPEAEFKDLPQEYLREIFEGYLELYIWEFIYYHVFLGQGRQWRGNIFKLFQMARQEAISTEKDPKKIAEFALWLSQGGEASTSQLDKELQQPMADEFAESIFAMFQSQPKTIHQNDIKEVLGVAVYDATELAIMFMSSKALLLPAWPFHRPVENDWPTTDFENERLPNVKSNDRFLVFRPALLKFGNADGENHDVHVILCKPARLYF
ncbi:hypothetical protein CRV24_007841 [Beauveria bassiana]|nr:hypothetical protein CRV24_007841 [Beauveria bassiana]KAH8715884.1 hypothetical protein HC256_004675 [Beauveria bassiana]